jgi:DNA repair photolyase
MNTIQLPVMKTLFDDEIDPVAVEQPFQRLPRLELHERRDSVLHPSPFADHPDVLALNLGSGCAHRCGFCSVRAHTNYRGDSVVTLAVNTADLLDRELRLRAQKPRAVYVCPSGDPFAPWATYQRETLRVVGVLARHGVEAWLMTRGVLRPATLDGLAQYRHVARVTVALTTLDRNLQRVLEPLTAPPALRLRQLRQLRALGVPVSVTLAPLLPGVTDRRDNLTRVLAALADLGVRHVTAGYAFLRPRIAENLRQTLEPIGLDATVLDEYDDGPVLHGGGIAAAQYLPRARRQRGYAALVALASRHGMTVGVDGLTNPDFPAPPRAPRSGTTSLPLRRVGT